MKMALQAGFTNINDIKEQYNQYALGGMMNTNNPLPNFQGGRQPIPAVRYAQGGHLFQDGGDKDTYKMSQGYSYGIKNGDTNNPVILDKNGNVVSKNQVAISLPEVQAVAHRQTDPIDQAVSKYSGQLPQETTIGQDIGNAASSTVKGISDGYQAMQDSPWGTVYDAVNLGLYAAAPFTGGATLPFAAAMTLGSGLGAAANIYETKNVNLNNGLDAVAAFVPGSKIATKLAPKVMRMVGKNTKYVRNANLFLTKADKPFIVNIPAELDEAGRHIIKPARRFELSKTHQSLMSLSRSDPKYIPYTALRLLGSSANGILNTGAQLGNDIYDNVFNDKKAYGGNLFKDGGSGNSKIHTASTIELAQNRQKQEFLRSRGINVNVDGSWGPWQEQQYTT